MWKMRRWIRSARETVRAAEGKYALAISDEPRIYAALAEALPPDWTAIAARDLAQAVDILRSREIPIVLLDRDTAALVWRDAVMRLSRAPYRCCVILLSGAAGENLWEEVARRGGYEVVSKPVRGERLARVIQAGWTHWRSQRELFRR